MPDIYLSINELNVLFQDLTIGILGLTNDAKRHEKVRISWPTGGAPAWQVTEDIVFLKVVETESSFNKQREDLLTDIPESLDINEATLYTRIMSVSWIIYGPNSYDNSQLIRDAIFKQRWRNILAQQKIYPIPDIKAPVRAPELYAGRWWERVDFTVSFNEFIVRNETISSITSAEIIVIDDEGIVADINAK